MRNGPRSGKESSTTTVYFMQGGLLFMQVVRFTRSGNRDGSGFGVFEKRKVLEKRKESMSMSDIKRIKEGGLNFASIYQSCL